MCFFKQKTAYEMRISDWSSDVCSSDLGLVSYTEPYGNGPFDDQQAGAKVDALMGEFWVRGGAAAYSVKVAETTAHVHGKTFIGAESFTGRPAQSRWLEQDRKRVVKGKRVSVRVALGGRRIIQKIMNTK